MAHILIHRGLAKKNFKENTLKSFKYCFTKKYGIETDLHCTKDNIIICFHDFSLKKKFKTNKLIKNLTFSEINKIAKKFGYYVPQLKELIKISNCEKLSFGDASISSKHCNFFLNNGSAKAKDLENLIIAVKKKVYEKTGINLELEIQIIGQN